MNHLDPFFRVQSLSITDQAGRVVLNNVSVNAAPRAVIGIVGPSGAGKSTLALSLLGEIRPGLRHETGTVEVAGEQPLLMSHRERRRYRRSRTAWLGQDPAAALTPTMSLAALIAEPLPRHGRSHERIGAALTAVGLPGDRSFMRRRPHEISGGQRRRVALARALVRDPALLILDEPFAGLDPESRHQVLTELTAVRRARSMVVVVISHDMDAVDELTDELLVMAAGHIVEHGTTADTLTSPRNQTTRELVAALRPAPLRSTSLDARGPVVLTVQDLSAAVADRMPVVENATFSVAACEGVAIVGASGVGKTTLARTLVGLNSPRAGDVAVHSHEAGRSGRIGLVPQDPATALNPSRTVKAILTDTLRRAPEPKTQSVADLLHAVELDPEIAQRRPPSLSGGQRQRVAIARALAGAPDLLVCDEPTSALDPVIAAALLGLLDRIRATGLAVILISHELQNIGRVATRVLELRDQALVPMDAQRLHALTHHERSGVR